jgi:hypothetical protein
MAAEPDARSRLAELLTQAADAGLLRPSQRVDRAGLPMLPAFVTLPPEPSRDEPLSPTMILRDELAWARDGRFSAEQRRMLEAVNRWLRDGGSTRPVVPAEERSLELFDDEKAIVRRAGGDGLWGRGRLTLELLRCERMATPLVWEPCGTGRRLLIVENQATFLSTLRVLRETADHDYGGVSWGQGKMAPSRIGYATRLPFPVAAVDYFGDLDLAGLDTARSACTAAQQAGLSAGPQVALWELLLGCRTVAGAPVSATQASDAAAWLPAKLRGNAIAVLTSGKRIPQERLGYERLAVDRAWTTTTAPDPDT